jgi:hypothetical protein
VAKKEGISVKEAGLKLNGKIPGVMRGSDLEPKAIKVPEAVRAKLLGRVAAFYNKALFGADRAGLDYLKSRRLDDAALIESFSVGYCDGSLLKTLPGEGEIVEQLIALGVLHRRGDGTVFEHMLGRVTAPIRESSADGRQGNVVGIYGRKVAACEKGERHRYLAGELRGVLTTGVKGATRVYITEAIFDALALWKAGFRSVVAMYGAKGWTPHHEAIFTGAGITEAVMCFDNDAAGREATRERIEKLSSMVAAVHAIQWPEGIKDAAQYFECHDAEAFRKLLPQEPCSSPAVQPLGEKVAATQGGLTVEIGGRRYELMGIEKPSASALKATIKARRDEKFYVDTVALYSSARRKTFVLEAARFFCEGVDVIEGDVNRLMVLCEQYAAKGAEEAAPKAPAIDEGLQREAWKLARDPDLTGHLQRDFDALGVVGEYHTRQAVYWAMTSRKMDDPLSVQILSSSGAGKTFLQDIVMSLCPSEDLIKLTSLSDRALFYKGEDSLRHKVLAVSEEAGAEGAQYALRCLISDKKLSNESTVKNQVTGKLETQFNVVYGPASVIITTTNPNTDAETKSRFFILSVDESDAQTRAIVEAQRQCHTLEGLMRKTQRDAIRAKHVAFQRLLTPRKVLNRFEPLMTYGDDRLITRRDNPKYLNLALVSAFLHQHQRPVRQHPQIGEYIEVTLDDIALAHDLALVVLGQAQEDLSPPSRRLLGQLADYVATAAAKLKAPFDQVEWSRRDIREAFKWSDTRLRAHLGELLRMECLASSIGRQGATFKYRLMVEPEEIRCGARIIPGLKSVEQIRQEALMLGILTPDLAGRNSNFAGQNDNFAGENPHFAATSPQGVAKLESEATLSDATSSHPSGDNLAAKSKVHIDEIKPAREFSARQSTANGAHP